VVKVPLVPAVLVVVRTPVPPVMGPVVADDAPLLAVVVLVTEGPVVAETLTEVDAEPVAEADAVAEYATHRAEPTLAAEARSAGFVQAAIRHGATVTPMADCEPHWQLTSLGLQPTAEIADERQEVCLGERRESVSQSSWCQCS